MQTPSVLAAGVDRLLADCAAGSGRIVDLGGGTGGEAVRLARAGYDVTVVDPSPDALFALGRRANEAGLNDVLRGVQGDAESLAEVIETDSVDLVLCHGVLEVVDDPVLALQQVRAVLCRTGRLSLLVAQRHAAVLARVVSGQLRQAQALLGDHTGRWGPGDPLQRRFSRVEVDDLLRQCGFEPVAHEGVKVFTDLAPVSASVADPSAAEILAGMELAVCRVPELVDIAAQVHVHAVTA